MVSTRTPAIGHVVVVGNLTIDDVVLPDGQTLMARLGGNTVHSATAVLACGVPVAIVTRKGEDFPPEALDALAAAGADLSGVVAVPGPTVRNWVIYESDGRRHWLYRTPPARSAEVAPQPADVTRAGLEGAAVVHVAAMPLPNAERVVSRGASARARRADHAGHPRGLGWLRARPVARPRALGRCLRAEP